MPLQSRLPEKFGRYRILRKLGEGGMGAVYLAEDTELGRRVALKVPHFTSNDDASIIERFRREARHAAGIHHPNICTVYDVGQIDGVHYLTMPFIEGTPLSQRIGPGEPWRPLPALVLVSRLAVALEVLHKQGKMHRDLKPANIMLLPGTDEPVIMDFGLARSVSGTDRMTVTGAVVGTPAYMAPEQISGDSTLIGCATDIYALGVILYQLLTGELPFPGPGAALYGQILYAAVPPLSKVRPGLDTELEAICFKALEKDPRKRFQSMTELAAVLDGIVQRLTPVASGTPAPPTQRLETEPVRFVCPNCKRRLLIPSSASGKKVRCPRCKHRFELASLQTQTPSPNPMIVSAGDTPTPPPAASDTVRDTRTDLPRPLLWIAGAGVAGMVLLLVVWQVGSRTGRKSAAKTAAASQEQTEPVGKTAPGTAALPTPSDTRTPAAAASDTNSIGMKIVRIAAGSFQMGADKTLDDMALGDEFPPHLVTFARPFYLSAHKVTQEQFEKITGRNPSSFRSTGPSRDKVANINTQQFPVETVSFFDALEFCIKLSDQEGLKPCYQLTATVRNEDGSIKSADVERLPNGTGYRLPSEAEWEYCARAETTTRYSFGDDASRLGDYAWFEKNSDGRMHPVGEKAPNPWGLFDMGGLAWEWCEDTYHVNYSGAPTDGSAWLGGDLNRRVLRGGGWSFNFWYSRCASRSSGPRELRGDQVGFRVVRVAAEQTGALNPPNVPNATPIASTTDSLGLALVRISPGSFPMGSDTSSAGNTVTEDAPRHFVYLSRPFQISAYKTTQEQFQQLMGRNPSWFSSSGEGRDRVANLDTRRFPVERVSYFDAVEFCYRLSQRENLKPCYRLTGIERHTDGSIRSANIDYVADGRGYRLPTEAEWEYCARGGTTTRYWFGDGDGALGEHAWFHGNSNSRTHAVGDKRPNRWGLYDMGGLAWEWCEDVWHENYQGAPTDGSAWLTGGDPTQRVIRGGSWIYMAGDCRVTRRIGDKPSIRNFNLSFRVVRAAP